MSLLSKKSWHVRNRKNIERVRNDEAKAKEFLQIEQDRKLKAEQEFRIQQLKLRTGRAEEATKEHFNLFSDIEALSKSDTANQNSESKLVNWTRHLVRPDADKPWYCSSNSSSLIESSPTKLTIRINDPLDKINLKNSLSTHRKRTEAGGSDSLSHVCTSRASARYLSDSKNRKDTRQSDSSPEIIGIIEPKTREPRKKHRATRNHAERDERRSKKSSSKHKKHRHKHRIH